jgi:hypothetical protein
MTSNPTAVDSARQRAACLFAAAARHPQAADRTSLACLAAETALDTAIQPLDIDPATATVDALITKALQTLGALEPGDFADPRILDAAQHGQAALRGPS